MGRSKCFNMHRMDRTTVAPRCLQNTAVEEITVAELLVEGWRQCQLTGHWALCSDTSPWRGSSPFLLDVSAGPSFLHHGGFCTVMTTLPLEPGKALSAVTWSSEWMKSKDRVHYTCHLLPNCLLLRFLRSTFFRQVLYFPSFVKEAGCHQRGIEEWLGA